MTRRIAVFTGTRAEYGLLYWLMKELQSSESFELKIIVSGSHLSPEFGETWRQIENDGFSINEKVEMLLSSNTPVGVVKSMGLGAISFAETLDRLKPDLLVILGDRFEALAIAQAALIMRTPIAHLHGGEITEGAYDDAIRHAITKMSSLHFTSTEVYRQRVIQMGEMPETVFNVGALGLDSLFRSEPMAKHELSNAIDFELSAPYFLVTYHPVTLADEDPDQTFRSILTALDCFPSHQVILTYPNADNGGRSIIPILENYSQQNPYRVFAINSLGLRRYHGALRHAAAVIGNSSSGIIEAPSYGIPTVNIGARQRGRVAAKSVLHCSTDSAAITRAIELAISPNFSEQCREVNNEYGSGNAAAQIVSILKSYNGTFHKHFHDIGSST